MADIFDHAVLCNKCGKKMKKLMVERSGFRMRALECPNCGGRTYHPSDMEEFNKYSQLQKQNFQVKLRRVGNSYTVSIPKELIDFFEDAADAAEAAEAETEDPFEGMHKSMKENMEHMNRMVTLALEHANKLSLNFGTEERGGNGNYDRTRQINKNGVRGVVREKSETKPINLPGGKGFVSKKMKIIKMEDTKPKKDGFFIGEEDE
ncbi:MAG: hypothetical protein KKE23_03120 [Nanoarchaeota archaeon]|nr:hypothetical protein [Nanoarchaeota archaeon]